jgi:acetyl esterase/lipase
MALIYIEENTAKYHLDPHRIGVIGFSAGSHLAGLLSCLYDEKKILGLLPKKHTITRPVCSSYIYGVVTSDPAYYHGDSFKNLTANNAELTKALSLEKIIDEKTPAAFVATTANDDVVPAMNSLLLLQALSAHHVPFEAHIYESGHHGISVANKLVFHDHDLTPDITRDSDWVRQCLVFLHNRGFFPHE